MVNSMPKYAGRFVDPRPNTNNRLHGPRDPDGGCLVPSGHSLIVGHQNYLDMICVSTARRKANTELGKMQVAHMRVASIKDHVNDFQRYNTIFCRSFFGPEKLWLTNVIGICFLVCSEAYLSEKIVSLKHSPILRISSLVVSSSVTKCST